MEERRVRAEGLALALVRRAMTAAGIDHSHIDDASLSAAIKESQIPGVGG
jgi:hypothetical protein